MPDARHANLLEPEALVELFLRHPPQGFAAASEADLPVFGTDFDLLTTLEPAILAKIRRLPLFGLWSRLLRFPARFAGTTATEYAPLPKGLEPGALLDGFRERCAAGQSLLIVKDVPEVSPLLGAGDNEAAMRLARIAPDKGFIVVEGQALAYVPIDFSSTDEYLSRLSKSRRKNLRRKLKSRAADVSIDAAGRIMISAEQREAVGIDKEVVVVGNTGYFEIWDAKRYDAVDDETDLGLLFD